MSRPEREDVTIPARTIPAEQVYQMNHTKRGRAIIFNQEVFDADTRLSERKGSGTDANSIRAQLTALGFTAEINHNMKALEMHTLLQRIAKQDHSKEDCFACVILSHGKDGGIICARDGKVKLDDLLAPFKGDVCPTLLGKPKMFFIQACRGPKKDPGAIMADSHDPDAKKSSVQRIPIEADFLLAFAVIPGYCAFRNPDRGSCFIQALAKMLKFYSSSLDLLTILTRVCHEVAYNYESKKTNDPDTPGKKQMPGIVSMLTKDVYFIPKSPQPSQ